MATSGKWSNVGDWLLHCLLHVRNARVFVYYDGSQSDRAPFLKQLVSAFARFAALPLATRNGLGLNAIDTQSSLRKLLVEEDCLVKSGTGQLMARVLPADRAKREVPHPLIVGIAMINSFHFTPNDHFTHVCEFDRNGRACPLPTLPVPPPHPIIIEPDEKDNDVASLDLRLSEEEEEEEDVVMGDADENDDDDEAGAMATFFSKCPVCLEVPFPPWQTTTCGHLICAECHAKLPNRTTCPTCRQTCAATLVPQLLFAEVAKANHVKLRCRHDGCGQRIPWDMARAHHEACRHGPRSCCVKTLLPQAPECPWKGPVEKLGEHLVHNHGALERMEHGILSITRADESHLLVWVAEQVVVRVYPASETPQLVLIMTSLRHHESIWFRINVLIGNVYNGVCHLKIRNGFKHYFPCPHPKANFTLSLARYDNDKDLEKKKRARDDDDQDDEEPKVKEARVEGVVDEKTLERQ